MILITPGGKPASAIHFATSMDYQKKTVQEINSSQVAMREAERRTIRGDFSEALRTIQFPAATAGPLSYLRFIQRNRNGKKKLTYTFQRSMGVPKFHAN